MFQPARLKRASVASCRLPLGIPRRILLATLHLCCRLDGDLLGEAGDGAFVADEAVAFYDYLEYQSIVVAVGCSGDDAQAVAAGFAFHPELLAGAAPEGDEAGFKAFGVAGCVEEAQHQHLAGSVVLYDAWDQAVHFGKVNLGVDFGQFGGHHSLSNLVWVSVGPSSLRLPAESKNPLASGAGGLVLILL